MTTKTMCLNRLCWTALFLRFADLVGQISKRQTGMSLTQARILLFVACHNGMAMTSVARSLNLKAPATTAAVDGMERLGFVKREVSPDDARSFGVFLTEAGYDQIPKLADGCREAFTLVAEKYGEKAADDFAGMMMPGGVDALMDEKRKSKRLGSDSVCKCFRMDDSVKKDGTLGRLMQIEKIAWALQSFSVVDAEFGLGSKAAVILRMISARGGSASLKELREMLVMKPVAMTAQVNFLEDSGLIARSLDADDRRLTLVSATDEGLAIVKASRDPFEKCFDLCFPGFSKFAPPTRVS